VRGRPYGSSTASGQVSAPLIESDLAVSRAQGRRAAEVAAALKK